MLLKPLQPKLIVSFFATFTIQVFTARALGCRSPPVHAPLATTVQVVRTHHSQQTTSAPPVTTVRWVALIRRHVCQEHTKMTLERLVMINSHSVYVITIITLHAKFDFWHISPCPRFNFWHKHWVCSHGLESRSERRFKTWFGPFLIWKPDFSPCEHKAVSNQAFETR